MTNPINRNITYSISNLKTHWHSISADFSASYAECHAVFDAITHSSSPVIQAIAGRKALAPNCAYLLLAKSLNHAFATLTLLQRGLIIDAGLTSRNGVETLLLLELLSKRQELCEKWAAGEKFQPCEVRKQLGQMPSVTVGDLIINVTSDEYDNTKFAYDWLSRITHANLESLQHVATPTGQNDFAIQVGGALSRPAIIAITITLADSFLRALLTCSAAHAPSLLESHKADFMLLRERITSLATKQS
ncbi:MAG: hypothetical protein ACYCS7_16540 [Acidimicrobiales bacterium]